jgi:hypothetical protein
MEPKQGAGRNLPIEEIAHTILMLRGHRVLLDADLAALYGVTTKRLNEQVRRNRYRFPDDFMFKADAREARALRSQFATLERTRGQHRKYAPLVFTEHGAVMAASVLNSRRAVEMSIYVVRAFLRFRELLTSNEELARRLDDLEAHLKSKLAGHDASIAAILSAVRELRSSPPSTSRGIGFTADLTPR